MIMEVMIILGSKSDMAVAEKAKDIMAELGVSYDIMDNTGNIGMCKALEKVG